MGWEFIREFSNVNLPVYVIREEIPESFLSSLDIGGINSATDGLVVPKVVPNRWKADISKNYGKWLCMSLVNIYWDQSCFAEINMKSSRCTERC
jgi:hypothetical protein